MCPTWCSICIDVAKLQIKWHVDFSVRFNYIFRKGQNVSPKQFCTSSKVP